MCIYVASACYIPRAIFLTSYIFCFVHLRSALNTNTAMWWWWWWFLLLLLWYKMCVTYHNRKRIDGLNRNCFECSKWCVRHGISGMIVLFLGKMMLNKEEMEYLLRVKCVLVCVLFLFTCMSVCVRVFVYIWNNFHGIDAFLSRYETIQSTTLFVMALV